MSEETTKRVNYHKNGNLPLFYIEKTHAAEYYTLLLRVPLWCTRRGSNPNSTASEAVMLSNYTTGT